MSKKLVEPRFRIDLTLRSSYGSCTWGNSCGHSSFRLLHEYTQTPIAVHGTCAFNANQKLLRLKVESSRLLLGRVEAGTLRLLRRLGGFWHYLAQRAEAMAWSCCHGEGTCDVPSAYCSPRSSTSSYPEAVADCIQFMKKSAALTS
ncbi:hypothetical protein KP509_06G084400 [Ceratopteris richardii]|uniref:Uncharacterized protein n=1 Tax=Ceratopteris richardii TaxID=49495 RepID=A0A8T2UKI3_CERRI|nr:hypothetical protein KP509_06G084400 [Ceratopteris richardii]